MNIMFVGCFVVGSNQEKWYGRVINATNYALTQSYTGGDVAADKCDSFCGSVCPALYITSYTT